MKVEKNKVVGIHYSISIKNNEIIYSTLGFDAEELVQGSFSIFPMVAKALEGRAIGDELEVTLMPSNAYGERNEQLVYELKNELFNDVDEFEIGSTIQIPGGMEVRVLKKNPNTILVDANHPLAGEQLHYKIKIISIRAATDNEIRWGRTETEIKACSGEPGCC